MKNVNSFKNYFRLVVLIILVVGIASCSTSRKTTTTTTPKPATTPTPTPKPEPIKEVKEEKKDELVKLKVALIMPFELDKNFGGSSDNGSEAEINAGSIQAINFYEGAQMAIDSLKQFKKEVTLTSYDAPSDSVGIARMFSNPAIKETNLVIGTFPMHLVNAAVTSAKRTNVNLIITQASNPESFNNKENAMLAYASTLTQCREMVKYTLDQYPDSKVILVYRTVKREDELAAVFKDEINKLKWSHEFIEFNASIKNTKDFGTQLSTTKRNVVFLVSSDEAFVSTVVNVIEAQNIFGVVVAGLPTWQNFEAIDFMAFKNVQTILFDNNFIGYDSPAQNEFRNAFISKYQSDPQSSGFNGFDLVFNIGRVYENKEDQSFHKLVKKAFGSSNSYYDFDLSGNGGLENRSISVLRFNDYKLERINKK